MKSDNYRRLLNNEYQNQELSKEDFDNTLMEFAKQYYKELSDRNLKTINAN